MNKFPSENEMRRELIANGWAPYWHRDNWIKKNEIYSNPDWAGISICEAYIMCQVEKAQKEFDDKK